MCKQGYENLQLKEIIDTAIEDNNIVESNGLLYNNICWHCNKNCQRCIGFYLTCVIDNLISVYENNLENFRFSLKDYISARDKFNELVKLNGDSIEALEGDVRAVKAFGDCDKVRYINMTLEDCVALSNGISRYFFNSKKSGRVEVDGFMLSKRNIKIIENKLIADEYFGYKLVGVIICYCGLYAILTKDEYCKKGNVKTLIRSVAMFNDNLIFNVIKGDSDEIQDVGNGNTVVFKSEQIKAVRDFKDFSLKSFL